MERRPGWGLHYDSLVPLLVNSAQSRSASGPGATEPNFIPPRRPCEAGSGGPAARKDAFLSIHAQDRYSKVSHRSVVFEKRNLIALRRDTHRHRRPAVRLV